MILRHIALAKYNTSPHIKPLIIISITEKMGRLGVGGDGEGRRIVPIAYIPLPRLVTTPTCLVLGEVGRYPTEPEAKCRMLGIWYGLCNTSNSESPEISNLMFQQCSKQFYACEYIKLPWLMEVHMLLDSLGLSDN